MKRTVFGCAAVLSVCAGFLRAEDYWNQRQARALEETNRTIEDTDRRLGDIRDELEASHTHQQIVDAVRPVPFVAGEDQEECRFEPWIVKNKKHPAGYIPQVSGPDGKLHYLTLMICPDDPVK